mgnify:CR=1 FL=1
MYEEPVVTPPSLSTLSTNLFGSLKFDDDLTFSSLFPDTKDKKTVSAKNIR